MKLRDFENVNENFSRKLICMLVKNYIESIISIMNILFFYVHYVEYFILKFLTNA